jgi:signal transduction histidine kinase/ActR/RegA family two-component response regulator/CHASE3 domain sensor protein
MNRVRARTPTDDRDDPSFARRWWRDLSLRSKGRAVVALPLVALMVAVLVIGVMERRQKRVEGLERRASETRTSLMELGRALGAAESSSRGWLLLGRSQFLERFETAVMDVEHFLAVVLDSPTISDAEGQRAMDRVAWTVERRVDGLQSQTVLRRSADEDVPVVPQVLVVENLAAADRVAEELAALDAIQRGVLEERRTQANRMRVQAIGVLGLAIVVGVAGGVGGAGLFSSGIASRVASLRDDASRLARGEPLESAGSDADEIGELERALAATSALLRAKDDEVLSEQRRLRALVSAQQSLSLAPLDVTQVYAVLAEEAMVLTGADAAVVETVDGDELVYVAATGSLLEHLGLRVRLDGSLSGWSVRARELLCCEDTETDPRVDQAACRRTGIRSMVVAPLFHQDEAIGVLKVAATVPQRFSSADVAALELLSGVAGAVIGHVHAYVAAHAANDAKNEYLSRMSHELRTPLNAILGFGQLLDIDDLTPEQRDNNDQIMRAGRHLLDLINEVLDIARVESGQLSLSLEPVDVGEAIGDAVALLGPSAAEAAITLEWSCPPSGLLVRADRQRLHQVLLNLISNGIKYSHPGGHVHVTGAADGTSVRIAVSDRGVGIPAGSLDRLFVPFDRLGADRAGIEGTGLGLALSQRLVEAMDGTLEARSVLGEGSTFTLTLQLEPATTPTPIRASHAGGAAGTVLYIEDNPTNVALVERVLRQRRGIDLVVASSGSGALALVATMKPDIVLLDLNLPDMPGQEVLQRLRGDPRLQSTTIVVISADASPGQAERLLHAGATHHLPKPVDVTALLAIIDHALAP